MTTNPTGCNPFRSSVSVDERLVALKSFTAQDCLDALNHPNMLQNTVRKALNNRLRKLNKTETDKAIRAAIDAVIKGDHHG